MEIKPHRAFLVICALNLLILALTTAFPSVTGYLAVYPGSLNPLPWLTHMFTHGGMGHLLGNALFVLPWAWILEPQIGARRFLKLWLVTGFAGALLSMLTPSLFPIGGSIGSSAACMGIMAAAVMTLPAHWLLRAGAFLLLWLVGLHEYQLTVVSALIPDGIGHSAHLGGIIAGLVWAATRRR